MAIVCCEEKSELVRPSCDAIVCSDMALPISVGEKFASCADLKEKVAGFKRINFVELWIRDSRTIDSAIKRKTISAEKFSSTDAKARLKYYEIRYACIHGGRTHKSVSTGKRKVRTFRSDCPFSMNMGLSQDGNSLVVRSLNDQHNHVISKETHQFYPGVRRLSDDQRSYAEKQLDMNVNKKKLQHQLESDTGKCVLLKDLSNIMTMAKRRKGGTRNDLDTCVEELRRAHGCVVDICTSDEGDFYGLYVQDRKMKQTFAAFPEILFLDATYKLLELQFPVYVFACEDSNGATHIIGLGALYTEDLPSVKWLVETFQKHNPEVSSTRLVMADKDLNERDVIKEILPHVKVLICLFHSLKTFKREINTEELEISLVQKSSCLEFISQMAYSKSEEEYNGVHRQFMEYSPNSVKEYFQKNWHPIRDEWVVGYMFSAGNFLNRTNNRLESLNGKLKQVITKNSSLEQFIKEFFVVLSVMRKERSYRAVYPTQKKQVQTFPPNSPEVAYINLLTSYASNYVLNQMEIATRYHEKYQWLPAESGVVKVQSSEGLLVVTTVKCSCTFFNSMRLPCRHVFSLRKKNGVSLYDRNLCDNRWTNAYFQSKSTTFNNPDRDSTVDAESENDLSIDVLPASKKRKRNSHEKFSAALSTCKKLANAMSLCSESDFERKLEQLQQLNDLWTQKKEVGLQVLDDSLPPPPCPSSGEEDNAVSTTDPDPVVNLLSNIPDDNAACPDVEAFLSGLISNVVEEEENDDDFVDFSSGVPSTSKTPSSQTLTVTKLNVKMPPRIAHKGRPKGSEKTVIGLTKKANRPKKPRTHPKKFVELSNSERERKILEWCLGKEKASECLVTSGKISVVKVDPTEIASEIFHPHVCLKSVKYLFEEDAWEKLAMFVNDKMEVLKHQCHVCSEVSPGVDELISCDTCLKNFHYACGKCKKTKKLRHQWFCSQCKICFKHDIEEKDVETE